MPQDCGGFFMIKSVSDNQEYIINSIMQLCNINKFDADVTYGNGVFWKNLPKPVNCFDINPQLDYVICASSNNLPFEENSINSVMFDPPFLTYIKSAREHNSIMAKRYGGYWKYEELELHYKQTIKEAHRILCKKGIFVVKCQDIIHNHTMHSTHMNVVNWAANMFRLKDMFILTAKNRIPIPQKENETKKVQKHARIHHSYFMVMEKI
jgi:tRNA G10  N-methylase Trm11